DIAAQAKVSRTTISRVLFGTGGPNVRVSEKTRAKILRLAGQLHYRPNVAARILTGKGSGIIGVLIDSQAPAIYFDCLRHLERSAFELGYRVMIAQQHENIDNLFAQALDFRSYGVDGIISFAHNYPRHDREIQEFMQVIPRVVYISKPALATATAVQIDIEAGIVELVRHLQSRGRRRIGIFLADLQQKSLQLRHSGYLQGLAAAGLPLQEELIMFHPDFLFATAENARLIFARLYVQQGADVIICQNDLFAAFVIKEALQHGCRIPDDLAVTGFDDLDFAAACTPGITTIRQPVRQMALEAVRLLHAMIQGETSPRLVNLRPELIIRSST
ncbi:MAG: LacI family transcriptional regulator, partial [Oligosphaeraceae bacterium]|nr:LacI family transcriptional regulator [Oligosphaeraceae bacterium]